MNFKEYQKLAFTTCQESSKNMEYAVLGLQSEIGELFEKIELNADNKEIIKEAGDIPWYVALICTLNDIELEDIAEVAKEKAFGVIKHYHYSSMNKMIIESSNLCGIWKKQIRDGKHNISDIYCKLTSILAELFEVCKTLGFNIENVLQINIEKLFDRKKRGVISGSGDNR